MFKRFTYARSLPLFALLVVGVLSGCGGRAQETPADSDVPEAVQKSFDFPQLTGDLIFASDRGGVQKIWALRAGSSSARQLTRGDHPDSWPRFSPDGRQILYTTIRDAHPEIWRMNRDGSGPIFLGRGGQASWAPDGRSIAFFRDNRLFIQELATAIERQAAPNVWLPSALPAWSPEGRSLALSSRHAGNDAVFVLDLIDNTITPLPLAEPCSALQWSKDGKKLLCQTAEGHICQVDRDGKNWEQLTAGADLQQQARYSPDGSRIVFCRGTDLDGPWQICVKDLASEDLEFVQLTRHGSNLQPDWHAAK